MSGAFTSEPLWVDLSDIQLDSGKPIIPADRVAAVAAPIRGVEKDKLVGEQCGFTGVRCISLVAQ